MKRSAGFTLLELLVVMTIAGLAMLAAPRLGGSWAEGAKERAAVRELGAAMSRARYMATATRSPVEVQFDLTAREWRIQPGGKGGRLPGSDVRVLGIDGGAPGDAATPAIRFYPDGGSSGGTVLLDLPAASRGQARIAADWLSGRIQVDD
ncbi:GspH/FimT family pseudopilin [Skermanella mucosa]|uniref:GspH/FimT family pseudopilin n=1 Tax=Skermanella mucosa TaxID=1789672 RepID=UPI00192C72FC|nr:GspH/FimT family pseudopilin [Skermanella mucosa]UEM23711.1 GspH/FimT family pseudopilin [Skermanella mucosa]